MVGLVGEDAFSHIVTVRTECLERGSYQRSTAEAVESSWRSL
jgi:hypothetical protein